MATLARELEHLADVACELGIRAESIDSDVLPAEALAHVRDAERALARAAESLARHVRAALCQRPG